MATAAEAATVAAAAPVETAPEATAGITGQDGQELPTGDGAAAPAKGKVSEVVRMAREKRALERKIAELTARPAAKDDAPAVTRESLIADLKKRYEEDPEALLEEVAGEDFVKLAARLAKREETTKAPATKIEALEKELRDLKAKYEGDTSAKAAADAKAVDAHNVGMVKQAIEAKGEDGEHLYPVLATLDPDVLDEPVAVTAYEAVARAFTKECREGGKPDGKVVKQWTEEQQKARFHAAFAALEAHYGKLRTPKTPSTPRAEEPEPSPTISKTNSSGHADPPARRASGTLTVQEALHLALKEHGLSH
jgi:hypothetical protein